MPGADATFDIGRSNFRPRDLWLSRALDYTGLAAAPATPAAGHVVMYAKTDKKLYQKDDAGLETVLGGGGGMTNPMTTIGDLIVAGSAGAPGRFAAVATGAVLASGGVGAAPTWNVAPTVMGLTVSGLTAGSMVFAGTSGVLSQDNANLFFDDANNNLRLFGGGIGTSGQGVLALGPGTAPTTSPVDTVQVYTADGAAEAGSRVVMLRDERGGTIEMGSVAAGNRFRMTNGSVITSISATSSGGYLGTVSDHLMALVQNGNARLALDTAGNIALFGAVAGTSGVGVLALGPGTAPTTSPVDTLQLWGGDFVGDAGSRGLEVRTERGGRFSLGSHSNGGTYLRMYNGAGTVGSDVLAGATEVTIGSNTNHPVTLMQNYAARLQFLTDGYVYINMVGLGVRAIQANSPDTAGAGYRTLRIPN
jgi:hypothetical protein